MQGRYHQAKKKKRTQSKMNRPDLIIKVKVLTEKEGGRKTPFFNGYRGQFYYNDSDWDATYEIIDKSEAKPGEEVELKIITVSREIHFGKFEIGKEVKIREGSRIVAKGKVIRVLNQKFGI
jgi:elongation factor Tu